MEIQYRTYSWSQVESQFTPLVESVKAWCLGNGLNPNHIHFAQGEGILRPMLENADLVSMLKKHKILVKNIRILPVPRASNRLVGWEYAVFDSHGIAYRASGVIETPGHFAVKIYAQVIVPQMVFAMIRVVAGSASVPEIPVWQIPMTDDHSDLPIVLLETAAMHDIPLEHASAPSVPESPQSVGRELDRLCLQLRLFPDSEQGINLQEIITRRNLVVKVVMNLSGVREGFAPDSAVAKRRAVKLLGRLAQNSQQFDGDARDGDAVALYLRRALGKVSSVEEVTV